MVADNFLYSVVVALFCSLYMRARRGYARTANHHGRCPPDHISRPHSGRECVGPSRAVCLGQAAGITFIQISVRADVFGQGMSVWVGPSPAGLLKRTGPVRSCPCGHKNAKNATQRGDPNGQAVRSQPILENIWVQLGSARTQRGHRSLLTSLPSLALPWWPPRPHLHEPSAPGAPAAAILSLLPSLPRPTLLR
jgi:hypothetical protein